MCSWSELTIGKQLVELPVLAWDHMTVTCRQQKWAGLTEKCEFLADEHGGSEIVQEVKVHELPQCLIAGEVSANNHQLNDRVREGEGADFSARKAAKVASLVWRHQERAAPNRPTLNSLIAITRHTLSPAPDNRLTEVRGQRGHLAP